VVAIGAPFGFDNSVTGIVSAKQRSLPDSDTCRSFKRRSDQSRQFRWTAVQFERRGHRDQLADLQSVRWIPRRVVAIPIDVAMNVSRQIESHGHVAHGKLGDDSRRESGASPTPLASTSARRIGVFGGLTKVPPENPDSSRRCDFERERQADREFVGPADDHRTE